jgi:hypothetical protein
LRSLGAEALFSILAQHLGRGMLSGAASLSPTGFRVLLAKKRQKKVIPL